MSNPKLSHEQLKAWHEVALAVLPALIERDARLRPSGGGGPVGSQAAEIADYIIAAEAEREDRSRPRFV